MCDKSDPGFVGHWSLDDTLDVLRDAERTGKSTVSYFIEDGLSVNDFARLFIWRGYSIAFETVENGTNVIVYLK